MTYTKNRIFGKTGGSRLLFAACITLLMAACSGAGRGNEAEAEVEAAMIEGREAARIFVNRPWRDTIELQRKLLEARSRRAKFDTAGQKKAAEAFDSAFISTIRTVNPDIARHLGND